MVFFRFLFAVLALVCIGCFVAYAVTNNPVWRRRGVAILKWSMAFVSVFFLVLFAQQLWSLR